MHRVLICAALLAGSAHAQVFKCPGPDGRITYSQAPCASGGHLLDPQRPRTPEAQSSDSMASPRKPPAASPIRGSASPAAERDAAKTCLDEREVRNVGTSGSSIHHDTYTKQAWSEQMRRARACEPLMTDVEFDSFKAQAKQQATAARAARPQVRSPTTVTSCDAGGCWGSDGARYNRGAGATMFRQDGKACQSTNVGISC